MAGVRLRSDRRASHTLRAGTDFNNSSQPSPGTVPPCPLPPVPFSPRNVFTEPDLLTQTDRLHLLECRHSKEPRASARAELYVMAGVRLRSDRRAG